MGSGNAVGYTRISANGHGHQGVSLKAQKERILQYCELHSLALFDVIEDALVSGKRVNGRPGMLLVMGMAEQRRIDHVVVYKLDRFARNTREALDLAELFSAHDVSLHSVTERLDTGSANGRLFFTLLSAIAAWERETISERTKAALAHKKSGGYRISRHAPYGYQHENGRVVINDREQTVIRRIQSLRAEGRAIRDIARIIEEEGHRNRRGRPIHYTMIQRVLKANDWNNL